MEEYQSCVEGMPVLAHEVFLRLCELLRQFNVQASTDLHPPPPHPNAGQESHAGPAQIRRLVLDAEAMRVAGLKRITAKQLALAAETVSVVLGLLPDLKHGYQVVMAEHTHVRMGTNGGCSGCAWFGAREQGCGGQGSVA